MFVSKADIAGSNAYMNLSVLMPMHLYDFDPQGGLNRDEKISMYQSAIDIQRQYMKSDELLLIIAHGNPHNFKLNKNTEIYWSTFYAFPNEFGLFPGFPAQWNIVREGLFLLKKFGANIVLKSRADSIVKNLDLIREHNFVKRKWLFTQQTTISEPYELGDCFMASDIDSLIKLWTPVLDLLPKNGLELLSDNLMAIENIQRTEFTDYLNSKTTFHDIGELEIYDFRFTWKSFKKNYQDGSWKTMKDKLLWGAYNHWISYEDGKIISSDRDNLFKRSDWENAQRLLSRT